MWGGIQKDTLDKNRYNSYKTSGAYLVEGAGNKRARALVGLRC